MTAVLGMSSFCALCGVAWAGYHFATTSSRFAIETISVAGQRHLTADQVRAALPVSVGDNVFGVDLDAAVRTLRENPWVAEAQAHRVLPRTIAVELREREPAAIADLGGLYLVDVAGVPFKRAAIDAGEGSGLPVITGISRARFTEDPVATEQLIANALRALDTWRAESDRPPIGEVHIGSYGALTLHTYDVATAIQLGTLDAGLPLRLRTFDVAWAELGNKERASARAVHVDPRSDHVTVAFTKDQ